MLKCYVRYGLIVDKFLKRISCKQGKWLKKYLNLNTQERNQAVNQFIKDFYNLLNNEFNGKTMEKICNRMTVEMVEKGDAEKNKK